MSEQIKTTPLMQQYHEIKSKFPDTLVFFQVGDFYELFFEDAQKAAAFLGIALTARGKQNDEPIPLCGVPIHAKDHYLTKLIKGGFKVALCDQLEPAQPGKVVARGITQVLTPGTLIDAQLLDEKSASYVLSFFPTGDQWGVLFGELLTAQLSATVIPAQSYKILEAELVRFFPDEIIVPGTSQGKPFVSYFSGQGYYTSTSVFSDTAHEDEISWISALRTSNNQGVVQPVHQALRLLYQYLKRNQAYALEEFTSITMYHPDDFLNMDAATQRHLELVKNNQDGGRNNTLFSLLDQAATAMGSRLIKKWLVRPLLKRESIIKRQEVVEFFIHQNMVAQQLYQLFKSIGDIERIVGRIAIKRGSMHDYVQLGKSLGQFSLVQHMLGQATIPASLRACGDYCQGFDALYQLLTVALNDDSEKEWLIKPGFDARLDELRSLVHETNALMVSLERTEQIKTGINSLKVRYNSVHGYYIEITKPNLHLVPSDYIRHQTLVGKERFTTLELKNIEQKIIEAQHTIASVEQELFDHIKRQVSAYVHALRKAAYAIAHVDGLLSFALVAYNNGYTKPSFNDVGTLHIVEGRHPVVEQKLGARFIANDALLNDEQSLLIITGPNMGGKSTFLRQTALLSIMAQCGSFVPARIANMPLFDALFTRIGASDNVAEGKSTFLVEMEETAHICAQATKNSLIILDEVGRGTSTFDGLAIAQAVVEYIYTHLQARCLFATHYHELTALKDRFAGINNYYAASRKTEQGILLLYKIVQGIADGSFGLEVAKLAHLPRAVVARAHEIITALHQQETKIIPAVAQDVGYRADLRQMEAELAAYKEKLVLLQTLDIDTISPRQAWDILLSLQQK